MAYFVSFWVAAAIELTLRRGGLDRASEISSLALFAGGFVGCLLVFSSVFLLVYPERRSRSLAFKVLCSSILCGILAVVGWTLGPSVGTYIWYALHALGQTPPTETFQNALYGDSSRQFSLFVVWQTGTAFLLGLILHHDQANKGRISERIEGKQKLA